MASQSAPQHNLGWITCNDSWCEVKVLQVETATGKTMWEYQSVLKQHIHHSDRKCRSDITEGKY